MVDAIRLHRLRVFAPEQLQIEFLRVVRSKAISRDHAPIISIDQAREAIGSFRQLPIIYLPARQLSQEAERLTFDCGISADDAWYGAAALAARAELWMSHEHADGLAEAARSRGLQVRLLIREAFSY